MITFASFLRFESFLHEKNKETDLKSKGLHGLIIYVSFLEKVKKLHS